MSDVDIAKSLITALESNGNIIVGTGSGIRPDGTVNVAGNGKSVNAICGSANGSGEMVAIKSSNGQWYAKGANDSQVQNQSLLINRKYKRRSFPDSGVGGMVLWFDVNWILTEPDPRNPQFLKNVLDFFLKKNKVIWTIESDNRIFDNPESILFRNMPAARIAIAAGGYQIKTVTMNDLGLVKGLFYLPLFSPDATFFSEEIKQLRRIGKTYGCLLQGEWQSWGPYDSILLSIAGTKNINVNEYIPEYAWEVDLRGSRKIKDKFLKGITGIQINATAALTGNVKPEHSLMRVAEGTTVLFVPAKDIPT